VKREEAFVKEIPPELLGRLMAVHSEQELRQLLKEHPELLPVIEHMTTQAGPIQQRSDTASIPSQLRALLAELQSLNRLSDMPQRIKLCERALDLVERDTQQELWTALQIELGNSLAQNPHGERAENIERAIHHYDQALKVYTREAFPAECRQTSRNLGNLHFEQGNWGIAVESYGAAVEAGNLLLAGAYTEIGRKAEVGESSIIYSRAAYCMLKLHDPTNALLWLEQGKTRLLAEALAFSAAALESLSDQERHAMTKARETVHALESEMRSPLRTPGRRDDLELGKLLRRSRADLNRLIEELRSKHPGFMPTGLDLPGILGLIPEGGALVAPLVTSKGSAVFVIPHGTERIGSEHVVWVNSLTESTLLELLDTWIDVYLDFLEEKTKTAFQRWLELVESVTGQLWIMLINQVYTRLNGFGLADGAPVVLTPQGRLGLLPLHAAWREVDEGGRAFIDDYTVTYSSSLYALSISQQRIQDASCQKGSWLGVINPTKDLDYAALEGKAVEVFFDSDMRLSLAEDRATKEAAIKEIPRWSYLHFSCHGFYDWKDVMQSGLKLANGTLTLSDIISSLDLHTARLVTLSACETGLTEIREAPDEFVGLPAGFLQSGAPGVVCTLWAVNDAATSLLMRRFYLEHLENHQPPGKALRAAQRWLRDATRQEIGDTCLSLDRMSPEVAHREIKMGGNPKEKRYANPYFWAAFTFTGA
jgi:CHAT domain-containing protein/tetratricopeptide (TPR) repeat protein